MANGLIYVPRSQDYTVLATLSATSAQTGYAASQAATDDPSEPWKATSGSGTLTVTLDQARLVDTVAVIAPSIDDGGVITVGGVTGLTSLVGQREASGYPRDLVGLLDAPVSVSAVTLAFSGNSVPAAIGRVIVGLREELPENLLLGVSVMPFRQQYDDRFDDYRHTLRYDISVEGWMVEGDVISHDGPTVSPGESAQRQLDDWWFGTKAGFYPTLIVIEPDVYPPMWVRMTMELPRVHQDAPHITRTRLRFEPMSRGLEVVD